MCHVPEEDVPTSTKRILSFQLEDQKRTTMYLPVHASKSEFTEQVVVPQEVILDEYLHGQQCEDTLLVAYLRCVDGSFSWA